MAESGYTDRPIVAIVLPGEQSRRIAQTVRGSLEYVRKGTCLLRPGLSLKVGSFLSLE